MAPILHISRKQLLSMLRAFRAPKGTITLGRGSPEAIVGKDEDGWWRLRLLEMDVPARDAAYAVAKQKEPFFWMPESEWRFLKPGQIVAEAATRRKLAALIEQTEWRW